MQQLSPDQHLLVRRGLSILESWFAQQRSPPELPPTFTENVGWPALWQALHSSSYWFSAEELQCLAACWSCRAHVYTHLGHGGVEEHAVLFNSEASTSLYYDAHVVLHLREGTKRGRFTRLVQGETINVIQQREYEEENDRERSREEEALLAQMNANTGSPHAW